MNYIIEEAKEFMINYLKNKTCDYEIIHPWRKDTDFIVLHSLRVHAYALKIMKHEKVKLTNNEQLLVELAALLHDIGRANVTKKDHGSLSAKVVNEWLKERVDLSQEIGDASRLLKLIENHSDKGLPDSDYCSRILKDADILDEIGIMSMFMTAYRVNKDSPFVFNEFYERLNNLEMKICQSQLEILYTNYARKIMKEKIKFIELVIKQLKSEIEGTHQYYLKVKENK